MGLNENVQTSDYLKVFDWVLADVDNDRDLDLIANGQ